MTDTAQPAVDSEIAAIRRRYYKSMIGIFLVDIAMAMIFIVTSNAWYIAPRSILASAVANDASVKFLAFALGTSIQELTFSADVIHITANG